MAIRQIGPEVYARRGAEVEGQVVIVFGIAALVAAAFIGRANAFHARFELVPGSEERSELRLRDGDLYLQAARPLDLRCATPDPMDPQRHAECTLATDPSAPLETLTLMPGSSTRSDSGLTLTPLVESLRFVNPGRFDLVLRRGDGGPERLELQQGTATELGATGDKLTAFAGPDGPLVLWEPKVGKPVLLAPPIGATTAPSSLGATLEYVPRTAWTVAAETRPESLLVWLGVVFMALGFVLLAAIPSLTITLAPGAPGSNVTRVAIRSTNRAQLVEHARRVLLNEAA